MNGNGNLLQKDFMYLRFVQCYYDHVLNALMCQSMCNNTSMIRQNMVRTQQIWDIHYGAR